MKRQSPELRVRGSPATPLPDWLPLALALAIVVVWGATPVLTKLAAEEIGPLTVAVLRTLLGGVAAAPLALALRLPLPPRSLACPLLSPPSALSSASRSCSRSASA
jgi:drug/metabolite transporter (DMT)-like permease